MKKKKVWQKLIKILDYKYVGEGHGEITVILQSKSGHKYRTTLLIQENKYSFLKGQHDAGYEISLQINFNERYVYDIFVR